MNRFFNFMPITIAGLLGLSIAAVASPAFAASNSRETVETIEFVDSVDDDPTDALRVGVPALARFGPFFVTSDSTAEMVGVIDATTPRAFHQMMARYPAIHTLRMIECPGSEDDDANLSLARMVRQAKINTFVPAKGSIRSGAVELFLAGVEHRSEPGAEFGVHSWQDEDGREAQDYPSNDPVHASYINYYVDMGLDRPTAIAFYNFTNAAAPSSGVHYMTPMELSRYHLTN
jgi:hypothetical protein